MSQALAINPEVRKSQQAINQLRGRKTEALADALPDVKVYGLGIRYRDPSLLNSSSFDSFPPDLRDAYRDLNRALLEDDDALMRGSLIRLDFLNPDDDHQPMRKIMRRLLRDVASGKQTTGDTTTLEDLNVLASLRQDDE